MKILLFKHISRQTRDLDHPRYGTFDQFLELLFNPSCLPMWSDIRVRKWEEFGKGDEQVALLPAIREKIKTIIETSTARGFQQNWAFSFNRCLHELKQYENRAHEESSIIPTVMQYMREEIGDKLSSLSATFADSPDALRECVKLQKYLVISETTNSRTQSFSSDSSSDSDLQLQTGSSNFRNSAV